MGMQATKGKIEFLAFLSSCIFIISLNLIISTYVFIIILVCLFS